MTGYFPIDADTMHKLAWALVHFVWQGALVGLLAAAALKLLRRRGPRLRYAVSILALAAMAAAPAATYVVYSRPTPVSAALSWLAESMTPAAGAAVAATVPEWSGVREWSGALVLAWMAGVAICALRLTTGWLDTRRLLRSSEALASGPARALFDKLRRRLKLKRQIRLLLSAATGVPLAAGWLRPAVVLPVTALTGLDEGQLRAVLAHELAHIRRHDFAVNLLQRAVESLLFYHPAVWWLSNRIRAEREHCCDDLAIQVCGDPLTYAQALMELERRRTPAAAFAMAATGGGLKGRIRRILGLAPGRGDWREAVLVWTFVLTAVIAGVWSPATAIAQESDAAAPAVTAAVPTPMVWTEAASVITPNATPNATPGAISTAASMTASVAQGALMAMLGTMPAALPQAPAEAQAPRPTAPESGRIEGVVVRRGAGIPVPRVAVHLEADRSQSLSGYSVPPGLLQAGELELQMIEEVRITAGRAVAAQGPLTGSTILRLVDGSEMVMAGRIASTTTDENGRFSFQNVPPGRYRIVAERNGYVRSEYGQRAPGAPGLAVALTPGQILSGIGVELTPASAITGRVQDPYFEAVRDAVVRAMTYAYRDGERVLTSVRETTTNDLGEFRISDLQPGRYVIMVSQSAARSTPMQTFSTSSSGESFTFFTPMVHAAASQPAGRVFVPVYYPGVTNADQTALIDVPFGSDVPIADITMVERPTVRIRGRIVADVPGAPVSISLLPRGSRSGDPSPSPVVRPDASGNFEFTGVIPGEYNLVANSAGAAGSVVMLQRAAPGEASAGVRYSVPPATVMPTEQPPRLFASLPLDVGEFDIDGLQLVLRPGFAVSGRVETPGLSSPVALSGLRLTLQSRTGQTNLAARSGDDGAFVLTDVQPGEYRLVVAGLPAGTYVRSARLDGVDLLSPFRIDLEPRGTVQIVLGENPASLDAVVVDSRQQPVAGAVVVLVPDAPLRQRYDLYRSAAADDSGRVQMSGLIPGNYRIFAWSSVEPGAWTSPEFLNRYEQFGQTVTADERDALTVTVPLIP